MIGASFPAIALRVFRLHRRDLRRQSPRHAAFAAPSLLALCQSAAPPIWVTPKAVPDQGAFDAARRSFASAAPFMV